MFRRKSLSFSKKRSSASPPPSLADVEMGTPRERLNSDSQATLRHNSERKSFRRLKDFIGGHKDKGSKKQELKSQISNPIPVHVRRYGVDNTDYITGLPAQPEEQVKVVGVEEEIHGFYNSLPRPKKSTPEKVAIISGKAGSSFVRSGSIRSTTGYQVSTLTRVPMHPKRKIPSIPQDDKHNSVSSEESGVSVSYECEDSQRLDKCKWFHGIVKPTLADKALKKHGDFLVRENITGTPLYYTSVRWDDSIQHVPIKMTEMFPGGGKSACKYSFDEGAFDSVPQLIHAHMKYKIPIGEYSGILLLNPVNKGKDYEDIDNTEQKGQVQEPVSDEERSSKSPSELMDMKTSPEYPVASQTLLERDTRSRSVPTSVANSMISKSPDHIRGVGSLTSLNQRRPSDRSEMEDDDTYMEMSSVQSFQCPPDFRCEGPPVRANTYSCTPEPAYSRSSTPRLHSSAADIPRPSRSSPYGSTKRNHSNLLCHTQTTPVPEPIKYDISTTVTKSGKGVLNEAAVQAIVTKVLETSTDQLAFHATLADAVSFKVLPIPGESEEIWWKRMKGEGSMNGLLAGLEVLGSTQGEGLWNRLWLRHHVISQWIVLCLTSMESLKTRTKLLSKFIDLALMLQGAKYSNIFGFMAVMEGLSTVQVSSLTKTWAELQVEYADLYQSYTNHLIQLYTQVHQGEKVFALEFLTIPSIQQLGEVFLPKIDTFSPKHYGSGRAKDLMAGLNHFAQGFSHLREILHHCPTFHWNAKKKLSGVPINLDLYNYFMRDHPSELLHQMKLEVRLDSSIQRQRMFNHILEILSDIAEPKQPVITSA